MEFLVETYLSKERGSVLDVAARRARSAAEALAAEGTSIRYLSWILLPEEETCFHLYRAQSERAVGEASRRAGFESPRIVHAVLPGARGKTMKDTARTSGSLRLQGEESG